MHSLAINKTCRTLIVDISCSHPSSHRSFIIEDFLGEPIIYIMIAKKVLCVNVLVYCKKKGKCREKRHAMQH
jgi:hypothetical protein